MNQKISNVSGIVAPEVYQQKKKRRRLADKGTSTANVNTILLKFMFSKKTTKIDEIFTVDLRPCSSKRQIDGEDFVNFRGLRKYELYDMNYEKSNNFLENMCSENQFITSSFLKPIRN